MKLNCESMKVIGKLLMLCDLMGPARFIGEHTT